MFVFYLKFVVENEFVYQVGYPQDLLDKIPMVSDVEGVTQPPVNSLVTDLGLDHDFSTYQHSCSSDLFS